MCVILCSTVNDESTLRNFSQFRLGYHLCSGCHCARLSSRDTHHSSLRNRKGTRPLLNFYLLLNNSFIKETFPILHTPSKSITCVTFYFKKLVYSKIYVTTQLTIITVSDINYKSRTQQAEEQTHQRHDHHNLIMKKISFKIFI